MFKKLWLSRKSANQFNKEQTNNRRKILDSDLYKGMSDQERNTVAGIHPGMKDFITDFSDTITVLSTESKDFKKPTSFKSDSKIGEAVYGNLYKGGFFQGISGNLSTLTKQESGAQLIKNVIGMAHDINYTNYNRTTKTEMTDFQDLYRSFNNYMDIMKNGGNIISYDLETLGGVNAEGHQQFDYITEFSASVWGVNANGVKSKNPIDTLNSVAGFTHEEHQEVKNYITSLRGKTPNELTGRDNVYISRLSLLSDPTFKVKQNEDNGFEFRITGADDPDNITKNIDNALIGLDEYRNIGKRQEQYLAENGLGTLSDYKKKYTKQYTDLVYGGISNSTPGLTYNNRVAISQNGDIFDDPGARMILGENVGHEAGKHVDLYQSVKYAQENFGQASHIPQGMQATGKFGIATEDQFNFLFNKGRNKSVSAHNAQADENNLFHIFADNSININGKDMSYGEYMFGMTKKVNSKLTDLKHNIPMTDRNGGKAVFLMDKTGKKNWNSNKGGLSFSHNPIDGSYKTYDGFRISADGKVTKEDIQGYGPKSGALYTHEFSSVDLNHEGDAWKKAFTDLGLPIPSDRQYYQEYSTLDKLTVMKSTPYETKKMIEAKFGKDVTYEDSTVFYTLLTNENQIPTMTGTYVARAGENGEEHIMKDNLKALNLKTMKNENGAVILESIEDPDKAWEMIKDRSSYRMHVDSPASKLRKLEYEDVAKLHRYTTNAANATHQRVSQTIAEMISKNKTAGINITQGLMENLTATLGWEDHNTKEMRLMPETVANALITDKYSEALSPLLNTMEDVFAELGLSQGTKGVSSKALKAQKNLIFQSVMSNVLEQLPGATTETLSNSKSSIFTGDELEKIDFLRGDLFPEIEKTHQGYTVAGENSKFISLDLTKNDGLLNMFHGNDFKNVKESKKANAGFTALNSAYDAIGEDPRFKGVWNGLSKEEVFSYQNGGNYSQLNHEMTTRLHSFVDVERKNNPAFGLEFARTIQDYSNVDTLTGMIAGVEPGKLKSLITNEMKSVNSRTYIADEKNKTLVSDVVNNYFMTFSQNDFEKQIKGLNSDQQKWMKAQYGFSKQDATTRVEQLIEGLKDTGITLGVNGRGKNANMFFTNGNGEQHFFDMYKYVLNDGVINHRINNNDYATNFSLNVNEILSRTGKPGNVSAHDVLDHVRITSNVQEALGKTRTYKEVIKSARDGDRDIIQSLLYKIKKDSGVLREIGPRKENANFSNTIKRAMYFNTNPIVGILPELQHSGLLSEIETTYNISDKSSASMKDLIKKMKKGDYRPDKINKLLASEQNLFFDEYLNPILSMLQERADLGNIDGLNLKELAKTVNPHTQDTNLAKGILTVDNSSYEHGIAKFDKTGRSVSIQRENTVLYDRRDLKKDINEYLKKDSELAKNMSIGGKLMSSAGDKYVNHNGKYTGGLTLKYMQMDSNTLKNQFIDDVIKVREGKSNRFSKFLSNNYGRKLTQAELSKASEALAEKAMSLSTYEQQSIMDSRVQYAAFYKTNSQLINAKKELIIAHNQNISVINAIKESHKLVPTIDADGNIKYQLGYEVKREQVLGAFGSEKNIVQSKFDGVFRGRFFNKHGDVVSQRELNKAIKSRKLTGQAALDFLNEEYNFNYQVINKYDNFGHKIYNDASEKSTVDSMDMAIGSIDSTLAKDLESKNFKGLHGQYLSREYIEDFLTPQLGKNFEDRILKERFAFSDTLQELFPAFKGVAQTTSLEATKHESISLAATNIIESLQRNEKINKKDLGKYYKALFGDKLKIKNGTLITDDVDRINVAGFDKDFAKYGLVRGEGKILQEVLNNQNLVLNDKKNVVGHSGYSHTIQAYDHQSGTYSSNVDINELSKERNQLTAEMRKDKTLDHSVRIADIDNQIEGIANQKGLKFDNRMNLNLQKEFYNNDSMALARERMNPTEFNKYFGHALNESGEISEKYLNKSMLDPVTSILRGRTLIGYGETRLSDLKGKDKRTHKHLLESYKDSTHEISVEKAEKLYSYQQGVRALDFNSKVYSQDKYDALVSNNKNAYNAFKEVDLSNLKPHEAGWLDLDIGGQGNTIVSAANNPYSHNIMIKTGLGGNEEHLAIARMPERHFEDSLIKTNHIKSLGSLQSSLQRINSGNLKEGSDDLIREQNYARKLVGEIKEMQKHDVTSKNGLAGDLISTRLSQSVFGKASSLTINTNLALGEDTYENLKNLNGKTFLDTAMFDGETLLKRYSKGQLIDAVSASHEAFEKMGYFKEDFMKEFLGKDFVNATDAKEKMVKHLSTNGDTFLATRFPRNQESSDKVVMGYLDTTLRGNQLKALGHTGASMKMDHDGDNFAIARITDNNGKSYSNYVYNGNTSKSEFIQSQEDMLMTRAVNENHHWDQKVRDRVAKEQGIATAGNRIEDIASQRIIDGKVYSAMMDTKNYSLSDMEKMLIKHSNNVKLAMDTGSHQVVIDKFKEQFKDDHAGYKNAVDEYRIATAYQQNKDEFVAKAAKNGIGETNVTNYKVKNIAMTALDKTSEDYNYKSSLLYNMMYLTEEAAISSKSSIKGLDPDKAKQWNNSVENFIRKKGDMNQHLEDMKAWSKKYVVEDVDHDYYWNKSKTFQNIAAEELNGGKSLTKQAFSTMMESKENKEKLQSRMVRDFVNTIGSLKDVAHTGDFLKYSSVGQSMAGVTGAITRPVSSANLPNVQDSYINIMKKSDSDISDIFKFLDMNDVAKNSIMGGPNIIDKVVTGAEEELGDEAKGIGRKIVEGAADLFKAAKGSKIAMGAVGIAAGVMMLGYVGGRPRPADTQAMEEANDYQQPQQGLMDQGMMPSSMGGQQGYVVNINARSDKGKNHAISAIQQAISSGTSSSVNISMNINDNYGNINDRDIQKAIKDAL